MQKDGGKTEKGSKVLYDHLDFVFFFCFKDEERPVFTRWLVKDLSSTFVLAPFALELSRFGVSWTFSFGSSDMATKKH